MNRYYCIYSKFYDLFYKYICHLCFWFYTNINSYVKVGSIRKETGKVDSGGAWESDSRGMCKGALGGVGEVVAREIDWGEAREFDRRNTKEVYPQRNYRERYVW